MRKFLGSSYSGQQKGLRICIFCLCRRLQIVIMNRFNLQFYILITIQLLKYVVYLIFGPQFFILKYIIYYHSSCTRCHDSIKLKLCILLFSICWIQVGAQRLSLHQLIILRFQPFLNPFLKQFRFFILLKHNFSLRISSHSYKTRKLGLQYIQIYFRSVTPYMNQHATTCIQ